MSEASERYRLAAEQGDVEAHRKLGEIYRRDRQHTEAAKWFQRAAELGDEIAQRRLAAMYHRGEGMARDHAEAAKWVYLADTKRRESSQEHMLPDARREPSRRPRTVRFGRSGEEQMGNLPQSATFRPSEEEPSTGRRHGRSLPYTEAEITLCTYIARFGRRFIDEERILTLFNRRPVSSIKMKVSNIAHMLYEAGYAHSHEVSPLSGKPSGETGRRTNWDVVRTLVDLTEPELSARVEEIVWRDS